MSNLRVLTSGEFNHCERCGYVYHRELPLPWVMLRLRPLLPLRKICCVHCLTGRYVWIPQYERPRPCIKSEANKKEHETT